MSYNDYDVDQTFNGDLTIAGNLLTKSTTNEIGTHANPFMAIHTNEVHLEPLSGGNVPAYEEGMLFYDGDNRVLKLYNDIPDVALDIGEENWIRVYNNTGSQIDNGKIVYINGAQGNRPTVALADNRQEITADNVIGVVTHDIADNSEGFITTFGLVRGVDTDGSPYSETWTDGSELYLGEDGNFTNVSPSTPRHRVRVGYAVNTTNNGMILVSIRSGGELKDLHDLSLTSVQNNDLLTYSQSLSAWSNTSVSDITLPVLSYSTTTTLTTDDGGKVVYVSGGPVIMNQTPQDGEHVWINNVSASNVVISGGAYTINELSTQTVTPKSTYHLHYTTLYEWRAI